MRGNLVEQIILSYLIQGSTMKLKVCLNWLLQTFRQLFKIENICTKNLPLWVEPLTIGMCSKVGLLLHPILISLCNLAKEITTSITWVWVQGIEVIVTMVVSFSKLTQLVTKSSACRPFHHFHTRSVPHFS